MKFSFYNSTKNVNFSILQSVPKILKHPVKLLIGSIDNLAGKFNKGTAFLYQTGVLTIESYNEITRTVDLKIPNNEVRLDFIKVVNHIQDIFTKTQGN